MLIIVIDIFNDVYKVKALNQAETTVEKLNLWKEGKSIVTLQVMIHLLVGIYKQKNCKLSKIILPLISVEGALHSTMVIICLEID